MENLSSQKNQGFSLMELIVVIVILGVIAGFALPNYRQSIQQSHERDMDNQLKALHAVSLLYNTQNNGAFYAGTLNDLTAINTQFGINLITNDNTTYSYTGAANNFTANATWPNFTIQITNLPISSTAVPANPCCSTRNCSVIPNCP